MEPLKREEVCAHNPSLIEVIQECLTAKRSANRRPAYVRAIGYYLRMFARGREAMSIRDVTRRTLIAWFDSRTESPVSRKTGIQILSVLLGFAQRCGYVENNPATQLERVSIDLKPPEVFTPAEVRRILLFCKRHMRWRLPQVVLGLFTGIRPTELTRLYWSNINLDRGYVRVDAAAAKTRHRRIVPLEAKPLMWLRWCKRQGVREDKPIGSLSVRWKRLLVRKTGVRLHQDCFRHCAASYMLASMKDAGKVARFLGNSQGVLLTRYHELIDPEDSRRFWWVHPRMRHPTF